MEIIENLHVKFFPFGCREPSRNVTVKYVGSSKTLHKARILNVNCIILIRSIHYILIQFILNQLIQQKTFQMCQLINKKSVSEFSTIQCL